MRRRKDREFCFMVYVKAETFFVSAFVTILDWLQIRLIFKGLIVNLPINSHSSFELIAESFLIRSLAKIPRIIN